MALLVIVGSTLPWVRIWGVGFVGDDIEISYVNGISGDGQATLAIGILAAVLILWRLLGRRSSTLSTVVLCTSVVVLIIAGLVGVFNWSELKRIPGEDRGTDYFQYGFQLGAGLVMVTVAGLVGAGALIYQLWNDHFR